MSVRKSVRKRTLTVATAVVVAVAGVLATASPASAASRSGTCTAGGGWDAQGWTYFTYTGGYDYIDYYKYWFAKGGNQSNIDIYQINEGYSYGRDDVYSNHTWEHFPSRTVRIPGSTSTATRFTFIMDKNNDVDPRCTATTPYW